MIKVKVERIGDNGDIHSFSMSGHAESGPYGHDLVCAGASAVSFGAVNAISVLCHTDLIIDMEEEGGYLHCTVPHDVSDLTREKVQLLLEGMLISLQTIADQYGAYITIIDN